MKISERVVKKSIFASLMALEIYNKPNIEYREETFSILLINAYELLFKAKILYDNNEKMNSIYVYEKKKLSNGSNGKRSIIKKNRIGEPCTIELIRAMNLLKSKKLISSNIQDNIDILIEIRDNAIHLINGWNDIKSKVFSICAASIRNYSKLLEEWFPKVDISKYNFFITPLNYSEINLELETVNLNVAEKNLLNYIGLVSSLSDINDNYDLFVNIAVSFSKTDIDEAVLIKYADDGKKIDLYLNEEMFKKMYPFNNEQIIKKVKEKNNTIKANKKFVELKMKMQQEEKFCKQRYLDFFNKKGASKFYYNANFVEEFIRRYESS